MDEWPVEKKRRVLEIIRALELPAIGKALDFGCGNGVLTDVIRQALPPGWTVCGTDISRNAIENARRRYPKCVFATPDESHLSGTQFDFLFTHHVLEHAYDLPQVLHEIDSYVKVDSTVLHILPCGNPGSYEHGICLLRKDGISREFENRFFFEDEGHLRRLDTEQLSGLCREKGFRLAAEYYCNHYYGALDWITRSGVSFVRLFTGTSAAVDERAKGKLTRTRLKLFCLWVLRYPTDAVESRLWKSRWTALDCVTLMLALPLYAFSKPVDSYLKRLASNEWRVRRTERSGSEMYLVFNRQGSA